MPLQVWMNGRLVNKDEASINVYDHGLLYGDGVFEGIRIYHGRIFECEAHLRRLFESARAIRLTIPYSSEQLQAAIEQTAKANNFTDCYVRLVVTRGVGALGISPEHCGHPSVFIITDTIKMYPAEVYQKGMAIIIASVIRNHPNALPARVKSLNYLNNILAKLEAIDAGVPEAIMLNQQGNVAECTGDNIFIVKKGVVLTPTACDGILEGVTRQVMIDICRQRNIPCLEQTIQRHDLYVADECFLTGTGAEVVPVTQIDRRVIGSGVPGPLTRQLIDAFREYIKNPG